VRAFVDANRWAYRLDQREPDKARWVGKWLRELAAELEVLVSPRS
jgi:hypothetical protein